MSTQKTLELAEDYFTWQPLKEQFLDVEKFDEIKPNMMGCVNLSYGNIRRDYYTVYNIEGNENEGEALLEENCDDSRIQLCQQSTVLIVVLFLWIIFCGIIAYYLVSRGKFLWFKNTLFKH